ncbi:Uma2 family endonuclease [Streptomyces sp. YIM S03343]
MQATTDDLFNLPDLPRRAELIDGILVFPPPQCDFHSVATDLLVGGLRACLPSGFKVSRQMTIVLDKHNAPEPDVVVVRADAITGWDQMSFRGEDVLLAVEVVSPDSEFRDRTTKPQKYAAAGIPHTMTKAYVHMGMHRDQLKVAKPYDIAIDLTAVDHL